METKKRKVYARSNCPKCGIRRVITDGSCSSCKTATPENHYEPKALNPDLASVLVATKAEKHAAWSKVRQIIRNLGGTVPPKGLGHSTALRAEAARLSIAVPTVAR